MDLTANSGDAALLLDFPRLHVARVVFTVGSSDTLGGSTTLEAGASGSLPLPLPMPMPNANAGAGDGGATFLACDSQSSDGLA